MKARESSVGANEKAVGQAKRLKASTGRPRRENMERE